jgi:hypothetical protein
MTMTLDEYTHRMLDLCQRGIDAFHAGDRDGGLVITAEMIDTMSKHGARFCKHRTDAEMAVLRETRDFKELSRGIAQTLRVLDANGLSRRTWQ